MLNKADATTVRNVTLVGDTRQMTVVATVPTLGMPIAGHLHSDRR